MSRSSSALLMADLQHSVEHVPALLAVVALLPHSVVGGRPRHVLVIHVHQNAGREPGEDDVAGAIESPVLERPWRATQIADASRVASELLECPSWSVAMEDRAEADKCVLLVEAVPEVRWHVADDEVFPRDHWRGLRVSSVPRPWTRMLVEGRDHLADALGLVQHVVVLHVDGPVLRVLDRRVASIDSEVWPRLVRQLRHACGPLASPVAE